MSSEQPLDVSKASGSALGIEELRELQKSYFLKGKTRSFEFRDRQLRILGEVIVEREASIQEALAKDLGKSPAESFITEIGFIFAEIKHTRKNLSKWMEPRSVPNNLLIAPARSKILYEPKGQTLIIGPWNYPFQLLIAPLIGAIAAGNTAILKPSEIAVHTARVVAEIINEGFCQDYIAVVQGGVDVSTSLLTMPWDHVFFTGSTAVGRIVAEACGKTLSPTTLELGGKSPCIVDRDANLLLAAKRIVWGKFTNAGQTCVAPDYVWVHKEVKAELVELIKKQITTFFGKDPQKSPDYGRIITAKHCERLASFLTEGKVIVGGDAHINERYIAPTLLDNISFSSRIMQEEIFGPILPVLTFDSISEVISSLGYKDRPLALYYFGKDADSISRIETEVSFGGGCINDAVIHLGNPELPFGGVGASGMGCYHGYYSFDTFSHKKAMIAQSSRIDVPVRYPPLSNWKQKVIRSLMSL